MANIIEKSFYITSLFANIKSEHNWSTNEVKTIMLLFSKMSKYRVYISEFDSKNDLVDIINKIPSTYIIPRDEFQQLTGVRSDNVAREINKVRKKLISKIINTPHPLDDDKDSGESISWFSKISYSNKKGEIKLDLNKDALERLVFFIRYSRISFENIVSLRSNYSIFTYLFIRIIKDISKESGISTEIIFIEKFKEKLSLTGKYKDINLFRSRVLDVIEREINKYTDLNLKYELIKEGRAFTKIKFDFNYKRTQLLPKDSSVNNQNNSLADAEEGSNIEVQLTKWGIRARTIVKFEEEYSLDTISQAIDITINAIKNNNIVNSPANHFKNVVENMVLESKYKSLQTEINLNKEEISKYLSAKSMGATMDISSELASFIESILETDIEKFKDYKPNSVVLEIGYFDYELKKEVRLNMHDFLQLI